VRGPDADRHADRHRHGGGGNDVLRGGDGSDMFVFEDGSSRDYILDMEDDVDVIVIDQDLYGGGLTEQEVVDMFATQNGASEVRFDFGGGDELVVRSATPIGVNDLVDDLSLS
jgi:Ca2+-binding RTX toxin-like protein